MSFSDHRCETYIPSKDLVFLGIKSFQIPRKNPGQGDFFGSDPQKILSLENHKGFSRPTIFGDSNASSCGHYVSEGSIEIFKAFVKDFVQFLSRAKFLRNVHGDNFRVIVGLEPESSLLEFPL